MDVIADIFDLVGRRGSDAYLGEQVTLSQHMLQAAAEADDARADSALITAALLHDIGHFLHHYDEDCAENGIDSRHEEAGSAWLERHFGPEVTEPVRLHVDAKRYLCAIDASYLQRLSPASVLSLELQGGPYSDEEVREFESHPHSQQAVRLRQWDDAAKDPSRTTPPLEHYRRYIESCLRSQPPNDS